ncbi:MAG: cell division protein ZapE [Candidatus Paracaedibacteraceae bacterium]|nr:cell division protein ZapE [Candidatus Paracaedibacteraceae bacterium]
MFGPISSVYYERINRGELQEDFSQALLLKKLDLLWEKINKPFLYACFNKHPKGLYIVGDVGRGKTYLMDLFYEKVNIPKIRLHYHIFNSKIHKSLSAYKSHAWENLAKEFYEQAHLLCLDEFQFTDVSDLMILQRFFKSFFALGGVLVTTANLHPNDFPFADKYILKQFTTFFLNYMDVYELDKGPDYRIKGKEGCQRVFIKEQDLPLAHYSKRSPINKLKECSYSFHSLCEQPVGIANYNDLLNECRSMVITDIKQLNDNDENSLIRFMQLIDLLYENKVNLFMRSNISVKDIYAGNKYKGPFKRTLSRLLEITSR